MLQVFGLLVSIIQLYEHSEQSAEDISFVINLSYEGNLHLGPQTGIYLARPL